MQDNYKSILSKLSTYIKSKGIDEEPLGSAHLESWVVASPKVIELTQQFMEKQSDLRLKALLKQMRQDVGLTITDLENVQLLAFTTDKGGVLEVERNDTEE